MRPADPTGSRRPGYLSTLLRAQRFFSIKTSSAPSARQRSVLVSAPTFARPLGFYARPAYITATGTGYAQQNFSYACPSCTFDVTMEKLAVAKLTIDLTAHLLREPQAGVTDMQLFLP